MDEKNASEKLVSRNQLPKVIDPAFSKFLTQVPQKLQDFFKLRLKRPEKDEDGKYGTEPISRMGQKSSTDWEVNLHKQLQIWRDNPLWGDQPPKINVSVPKGSLCNLYVKFDVGLPPDAVYNIVTDPDNKRVFKNIKEVISRRVLVDEGSRQVVELEQAAIWRFLWWSGTITVHVLVDQNREDHSMKFKQVKAGFMKKFEGCWRVEPVFVDEEVCSPFKPKTLSDYYSCTQSKGRIGSRVSLEQLLQPAIVPPPPISWYLRGITARTTEMLVSDLIAEAARIKVVSDGTSLNGDHGFHQENYIEARMEDLFDIKERWALHRRNGRQFRKK
ncbi:hypothetical protein Ancab_020493 [Ancistrocladus abbreviatus]